MKNVECIGLTLVGAHLLSINESYDFGSFKAVWIAHEDIGLILTRKQLPRGLRSCD